MKEYLVVGYAAAVSLQLGALVSDPLETAVRRAIALSAATVGAWVARALLPDWR